MRNICLKVPKAHLRSWPINEKQAMTNDRIFCSLRKAAESRPVETLLKQRHVLK